MSRLSNAGWLLAAALSACVHPPLPPTEMSATFRNIASGGFQLETLAPASQAAAFTRCKAAWFAERRGAATIGLSTPLIRPASAAGWTLEQTDVTLNPAAPPTPAFDVASVPATSAFCRRNAAWYR